MAAVVPGWTSPTSSTKLAQEIARGAAERAAVVSSGRVGRTKKLPILD
jgi:hypothetical protein